MPKIVPLTQGKFAIVDDADFELVSQFKWYAHKERNCWYACHDISWNPKKCLRMHRLIMGLDFGDKLQVDHISHNGLDNTRRNLRICTHRQNLLNRKGVKGIYWYKNAWMALIGVNDKSIYLGRFKKKREAIIARKLAEKKYFGEFTYGYAQTRA